MPVQECKEDGKPGYKWGESGKCYTYTAKNEASRKEAKRKAHIQGAAVKARGGEQANTKELPMLADELINSGYVPMAFTSTGMRLIDTKSGIIKMSEMKIEKFGDKQYDVVDAVVAVGDKFYGNIFVPSDVLKSTAHLWDGTYNDLSHLGTMYPAALGFIENIDYITGYNSDSSFDDALNAVRVKMHISHDSPKYKTWKSFVDVSKDAKRIPNVSIFGFSKFVYTKIEDLPDGVTIPQGASNGEKVITMANIVPFAITTCLHGKCDDKEGCGISSNFKNEFDSRFYVYNCDGKTCNIKMKASDEQSSPEKDEDKKEEKENMENLNRIRKELLKEEIKAEELKLKEREK